MKFLLFIFLPAIFMTPANKESVSISSLKKELVTLNFQDNQEPGNMRCVVFKAQEYCRAEMPPDFEFDFQFKVVSATVYFSGGNFRNVEKAFIKSNSLKPVKKFMDLCVPGTRVVFDDVKVEGPDKLVRQIPGLSLLLN